MGPGKGQGQGRPPEEVTSEQGPEGRDKQAFWLLAAPDSMGRKSNPLPAAGPLRVLESPQLCPQLQVWAEGCPNGGEPPTPGPP